MNAHKVTYTPSHLPHALAALALLLTQGFAVAGVNAEMQGEPDDAPPRQARSDIYLGSNGSQNDLASAQGASSVAQEPDCSGAAADTSGSNPATDNQ